MSFSASRSRQRSSQYFLFLGFFEVETKAYLCEGILEGFRDCVGCNVVNFGFGVGFFFKE